MKKDSSSKIIDLKPRSRSSARSKGLSKIEYQETLSAPLWLRVLVYGFFGIMIGFYLLSPIWDTESNDVLNLSLCLVFVFVLWVLHIFLSLRVTLSAKGIQFGYYLLSKQFKYTDVLSAEVFRYQLGDYLGWGIRKGTDGSIMYNVPGDQGIAVKIVVREADKRVVYAFSARRPEVICKKIQSHLRPLSYPNSKNRLKKEKAIF
ncbi:MAG: hypothetical protein ACWGSD_19645 [Thermodesulfobacteriota bacterium]